jgi:hypothetical protein
MSDFTITNDRQFVANMRRLASQVSTKNEKQSVLLAGAQVIRKAAKYKVPRSSKAHWYYPRDTTITPYAGKRARWDDRIKIRSGNLANSLYAFKQRNVVVSVGPRILRNVKGNYYEIGQSPRKSSGYYAAMLYGSAEAFRKHVTDAAASSNRAQMLAQMEKRADKIIQKYVKRYGL